MNSKVKETLASLDALIDAIRRQMEAEPPKPTVSDYLRLLQFRMELSKEASSDDPRPLEVRWVEDATQPEPDEDPTVPWEGDEPLK